ncbi:AraC family transcriptional regulator [Paenibacillus sp. IITD108]|uniref:AraC family transcriptional regulator n=1 Tax=Paenibacillus sp. IITD108 TaxID=3116649 RepID=UPI002F3FB46B
MKKNYMVEKGEEFFTGGLSLYVNRVNELFDLPKHVHDFIEICYVWEGSGFHYIGDETVRVSKGDIFFIPIGVSHIFRPTTTHSKNKLIIGNCIFDKRIFRFLTEQLPKEYGLYWFKHMNGQTEQWLQGKEQQQEFHLLFESLHREFNQKRQGYETMLLGLLLQLLIHLERALETKAPDLNRNEQQIENIYFFIREHLHEKITLSRISDHIGLSQRQLHRIITQSTGYSPSMLIIRERIKKSSELLLNPDYSHFTIVDIASMVGINDPKRFHRAFKEQMNRTPAQYRLHAMQPYDHD